MRTRYLSVVPALFAVAFAVAPARAAASDTAVGVVVVSAQFTSRTSLKVSSDVLQFNVADPHQIAVASVEFSAGARTRNGGEVVLSVEPARAIEGPGGAADVEASLSVAGDGEGLSGGVLASSGPTVAGRWIGSGLRTGRLVFSLRAGASGSYAMPLRFVLSTP